MGRDDSYQRTMSDHDLPPTGTSLTLRTPDSISLPLGVLKFFFQLLHALYDLMKRVRERVANIARIGDDHPLPIAEDDVPWHAHNGGIVWNVVNHHRSRSHPRVHTDGDVSQNLRARPDHDMRENRGMALAFVFPRAAERDALVDRDIFTHDRSFTNHDSHAVINNQPLADLRPRMNLDAGHPARPLRDQAGKQVQAKPVEPVSKAVYPDGVQAGIAQQDLQPRPGRRIALHDRGDVFADVAYQAHDGLHRYSFHGQSFLAQVVE